MSCWNEDCWQLIVPGKVYQAHGQARSLLRLFSERGGPDNQTTAEYHAARKTEETKVVNFMERLKLFHEEQEDSTRRASPGHARSAPRGLSLSSNLFMIVLR